MTVAIITVNPLTVGQVYPAVPDPVVWPDGSVSHAAYSGFFFGPYAVVPVVYTPANPPTEFHSTASLTPSFDGVTLTFTRTFVAAPLPGVQQTLAQRLDAQAEASRAKFLNLSPGQLFTYQQKMTETKLLQQWVTSTTAPPVASSYPLLAATVNIERKVSDGTLCASVSDVAANVVAANQTWAGVVGQIEAARIGGKVAINNAATVVLAVNAFNAATFP